MNIKLDSLKKINTGIILSSIKKNSFTRFELQKSTSLAAGTLSNIMKELVDKNIIIEKEEKLKTRGRNGKKLFINKKYKYIIGIKVRRGSILASINDINGNIIEFMTETLPNNSVETMIDKISKIYFLLKKDYNILGVGVAFPGQIDSEDGIINYSAYYNWKKINLKELLEKKINFKNIFIENDVRCMTLVEKDFLDPSVKNLMYIHLGHGVSTGIIINNNLLLGDNFTAGQIGHTFIEGNNKICSCGKKGCLETIASIPCILQEYKSKKNLNDKIDFDFFLKQVKEKDLIAVEILDRAIHYIGTSIGNFINLLNISTIILGGDMVSLDKYFFDRLNLAINLSALPHANDNLNILKSKYIHSENTIGAIYIILSEFYRGNLD